MEPDTALEALTKVFPTGANISGAPGENQMLIRYWVVPGQYGPRWLLLADWSSASALRRVWRPYSFASRVKWSVFLGAYASGLLHLLPGIRRLDVSNPTPAGWSHLGIFDTGFMPGAIYIGSPGISRKAVAFFCDTASSTFEYVAKVPIGGSAGSQIAAEVDALSYLNQSRPQLAPHIRYFNSEAQTSLQTIMDGRPAGRNFLPTHFKFLESLADGGTTTLNQAIDAALAGLSLAKDGPVRLEADKLISFAEWCRDETTLPQFMYHGDFAPWNLKITPAGETAAIDWEAFRRSHLPLQDLIHFFWMERLIFSRQPLTTQLLPQTIRASKFVTEIASPEVITKLERYFILDQFLDLHRQGAADPNRQLQVDALANLISEKIET